MAFEEAVQLKVISLVVLLQNGAADVVKAPGGGVEQSRVVNVGPLVVELQPTELQADTDQSVLTLYEKPPEVGIV